MRTSKTVNGVESTYLYVGGKLQGEVRDGHHIHYSYDSYGKLSVIKYYKNDTDYNIFYVMTNAFGDVISLHNANGTMVASYEYDSWGNVIAMTDTTGIGIATINPIRYRGYFYDAETDLYYLASRYYDPQVGRFINADGVVSGIGTDIRGYNTFAYCFNNAVNMVDCSGNWPQWIEDAGSWINNNIIQPTISFFNPNTNKIAGEFQNGQIKGSGSLTGGYSEFAWRLDDKNKNAGSQDGWVGGFAKLSNGNATGKIGIGNEQFAVSQKGVGDGLVATGQAGLHYKDGFGVGGKLKASVLSGRSTTEININGWQIEAGVFGEVLSVGAEATIGIFPTNDGGKQFTCKYGASAGLYGGGFIFRVKVPT